MAARAYSTGRAALRIPLAGDIARPFPPIPDMRPWLESRVTQPLDEAERLVGMLDVLDGDSDLETFDPDLDEAEPDAEPSLGWAPGEVATGIYALNVETDLEDEHDGTECELAGWSA